MNGSSNDKSPKQVEFDFEKIKVEPVLQVKVATFTPARRRALATKLERWAHQLRLTAVVLERRAGAKVMERPRIKRLATAKLVLN